MLILPRVCAEFRNPRGDVIFTVPPSARLQVQEAPDEIRQDPLFDMLIAERSLEAVVSAAQQRKLENDPAAGADAAGRKADPVAPDALAAKTGSSAPAAPAAKASGKAPKGT